MSGLRNSTRCATRLRILGTGVRLEVLRRLGSGPKLVHELLDGLEIEQSLLSHHLRVLRRHGFVTAKREGKAVRYRLVRSGPGASIDLGCCSLQFE